MKYKSLLIALLVLAVQSCIVQSPTYSTLEKVMTLKVGMTRAETENILGLKPYDLKAVNDSSTVYIYVYRVIDRRTLPFNTKPVNGRSTIGKYVQLAVAYSLDGKVISIESCSLCPDNLVTTSKIDFDKVIVFITITVPVLLIYFGLTN